MIRISHKRKVLAKRSWLMVNMKSRVAKLGCLAAIIGVFGACAKKSEEVASEQQPQATAAPAEPVVEAPNSRAEARTLFKSRCSVCHGENGHGDGPGAAALTPKPRDYTNAEWQKSVTDEQLKSVILMGGAAIGKSPIMPASPDLQGKDAVVDELVKIIRSFAAK
jgi:mono/diheme cytochrome c family protein